MGKQHKHDKKDNSADEEVNKVRSDDSIIEELNNEIEDFKEQKGESTELSKVKETLARQIADFDNFKKRVERDREDMMFFLKSDIFKKVLPVIDDIQRIITATPDDQKSLSLYEGIVSVEKKLLSDLERLGVKSYESKGNEVDVDKHEVMTLIPGEDGIIIDEFEKGYMIGDRVLRVAKVVVGQE